LAKSGNQRPTNNALAKSGNQKPTNNVLAKSVEKVAYNVFRMHIAKPTLKRGKIIQSNRKYQLEPVSLTFSKFLYLSRNRRDIADRLAKIFDVWPYNRNGLAP
jgi:hypothetical protein